MESDVKMQTAKEDETQDELRSGSLPDQGTNDDYSASQMPSTLSGDASGTDCDNGHTSTTINKPAPPTQSTAQSAGVCDSSSILMQAKSDAGCKKPSSSSSRRSFAETKTSSTANGNHSAAVSIVAAAAAAAAAATTTTTAVALADSERCRRTDGKNWRCSKRAVPTHHFCEKHLEHMARSHAKRRKIALEVDDNNN